MTRGLTITQQRGLQISGRSLVRTVIPDSEDLHAHYDATEISASDGDTISTWPDEIDGHDLTTGTAPTYRTNIIDGNPIVRFDRSNLDFLNVDFATVSQPVHYFVVYRVNKLGDGYGAYLDSSDDTTSSRQKIGVNIDVSAWGLDAGNLITGGSTDTSDFHISTSLFASTSKHRVDGSEVISGDAGSDGQEGLTVGSGRAHTLSSGIGVDIGEILMYPMDKSDIQSDVEQYLSDKWGIAI